MQKILILGGTQFIGRSLVERLIKMDQYELTLFNRQRTGTELFPNLNKIKGDRETDDIEQLSKQEWDYVVDLSCYYPQALANTLQCLNSHLKNYIFISTCSVYDNSNNPSPLRNEHAKTLDCNENQAIDRTLKTYGIRKAECERILQQSGTNHSILRPALVYGAYDHTDRFYYWLYQVKYQDILLLPEHGKKTFALTYVSDLVETIVQTLTPTLDNDVYNVISIPKGSIRGIVDCAKELLKKDCKTINASADFLRAQNVSAWTDMPLWLSSDFFTFNNQKLKTDLKIELTDFRQSVIETIEYYDSIGWKTPRYGMTNDLKHKLIKLINNKFS